MAENNKTTQFYERKRRKRIENAQLNGEEGFQKVREATLTLLDYKDYSSGELIHKLREKGYPFEIIVAVIKRMQEVGLINDMSYARALMRSKFQSKGVVGAALRADLKRKMIAVEIIEEIIAEMDSSEIFAKAEEMVQKKLRITGQIDFQKQRNRLISMLLRKGYSPSLSHEVVDNALEAYQLEE